MFVLYNQERTKTTIQNSLVIVLSLLKICKFRLTLDFFEINFLLLPQKRQANVENVITFQTKTCQIFDILKNSGTGMMW